MKNPTFSEFLDKMMAFVFDGLITGGTKEMKSRLHFAISESALIAQNGGFSKDKS